jgi:N-acetylglucosaminyl-diphospho-decaprenol L-rhamnosyltransferase
MTAVRRDVAVSIVIVNWHSADFVCAAVDAIPASAAPLDVEVLVVDNASYDDCRGRLALSHADVRFIQSPTNLGFGGANNLGARYARAEVLLFLNPDTVPSPGAIATLYRHLTGTADAGVVGGRLLNSDGSLQTSCVQALPTVLNQALDMDLLRRLTPRLSLWGTQALFTPSDRPQRVAAVSGACMMLRRSTFEAVNGFSPAFFMYGEDLDLCARIGEAGGRNLYAHDAVVVHHGGGSSRQAPGTFSIVTMCESIALLIRRLRGPASAHAYRATMSLVAGARLGALLLAAPLWIGRSGTVRWSGACRKWWTVLRWTLGLHPRNRAVRVMAAPGRI